MKKHAMTTKADLVILKAEVTATVERLKENVAEMLEDIAHVLESNMLLDGPANNEPVSDEELTMLSDAIGQIHFDVQSLRREMRLTELHLSTLQIGATVLPDRPRTPAEVFE